MNPVTAPCGFPGLGDPSRLSQRPDSKNAREQIREREQIYHVHRKTTTNQVNHIGKPPPAAGYPETARSDGIPGGVPRTAGPIEAIPVNARPYPPLGVYHRSMVDHYLAGLFADLEAARAADHQTRCSIYSERNKSEIDSMRLVTALRACAGALERHRLPVPRTIRDEIRLRRQFRT
jgi:hypothetical protein